MNREDWLALEHKVPDGFDKFVAMLAAAGDAPNELILLTRYQKVVRAVYDEAYNRGHSSGFNAGHDAARGICE